MSKIIWLAPLILLLSCNSYDDSDIVTTNTNVSDVISALSYSDIYPDDNPYSEAKDSLGKFLFWDPILSGNKDVSCATCHHPDFGYGDGMDASIGVGGTGLATARSGGTQVTRNAPTIVNSVFNGLDNDGNHSHTAAPMFWDNRTQSLESQALLPILSAEEMRGSTILEDDIMDTIILRLSQITAYQTLFYNAFGSTTITQERILQAIATFERGITASDSPFDRYMRGDETAMTAQQIEGMNIFVDAGCADCHNGPMFSDYQLHTIGVKDNGTTDSGASGDFDFRTPTLRNLSSTGPYMHNGVYDDLEDVIDFYRIVKGRNSSSELNSNLSQSDLDEEILDLTLQGNQTDEIIGFLDALNDNNFDVSIPSSVPSGLSVGGNIQ